MKINVFNQEPVIFDLPNGLHVHLIKGQTKQTYIQVDIPLGSFVTSYEVDGKKFHVIPGSAHFLEHKIFATEDGDAFHKFHELGLTANAHTTYRSTSYTISGYKHIKEGIKALLDMLDHTYFTNENVESEILIISEEISMYDDDPMTLMYQKMYDQMLHQHPLKNDIAGTIDDVQLISKDSLLELFNHFYKSPKRQLIIYGPIDIDSMKDYLMSLYPERVECPNPLMSPVDEPFHVVNPSDEMYLNISLPVIMMGIKYQQTSKLEIDLFKTELLMLFLMRLIFGQQSDFVEKMQQMGYIVDGFDFQITMEDQTLVFIMDAESENPSELNEFVQKTLLKDAMKYLDQTAFDVLKKAYIGNYIMALDDIETRIYLYGKYHLYNLSLEEAINSIYEITLQDVINLYHKIHEDMISILIAHPIDEKTY
ncbi:coenzyme PQQ biosynthesis protein PqqF [Acholeplasma oculi]|uniref:Peptidase, M16 family n=1 Tax=Acholeplasma oculi TaxID=35623 RepID=A0A061AIM8_9MOLU|nr:pitrilysin family protein [Acholeplasma oculi]CDR30837.1 Peptidase, M16 family [Acholeplasma oculi]SKC35199.1 Predicted Zn-dependent peptidase [Acholeplasma oculi]SUT89879.1 coenzyme PQQ biosynthesis protein PqqF [Acholeplasma oculi]